MQISKLNGVVRTLREPEKRAIRRSIEWCRYRLRVGVRNVALFGIGIFVVVSTITSLVAKSISPFFPIAVWFMICTGLVVWVAVSSRRDLIREIDRLEGTLLHDEADEVTIQSTEMVEFQEEEDEGACYALQLNSGRIVFVVGQDYYPSAKFPNTDFSLVSYSRCGGQVRQRTDIPAWTQAGTAPHDSGQVQVRNAHS